MRTIFAVLIAMLSIQVSAISAQEASAPFGLQWMVSASEIKDLGVTLQPVDSGAYGTTYAATNLPKALSDLSLVYVYFGHDDKLWRVAAFGSEFDNDRYGSSVRARYDQLAQSLAKNYVETDVYEYQPSDGFYGDADNFAYALSQNEAYWYRLYKSDAVQVELSANSDHEDTYWRLIYTHLAGQAAFKQSEADAELDAL